MMYRVLNDQLNPSMEVICKAGDIVYPAPDNGLASLMRFMYNEEYLFVCRGQDEFLILEKDVEVVLM